MVKFTVFIWAVCRQVSSWLLHVGRSLGHCAAEPLLLIMDDKHLGRRERKLSFINELNAGKS